MRMLNKLPYFVFLKGKKYKINADFRVMIKLENAYINKKLTNELASEIFRQFYPAFSSYENYYRLACDKELYAEALDKLLWFYQRGDRKDYHQKVTGINTGKTELSFNYEYDDDYIFGAFWDRGIDLTKDFVHWWKFKALFLSMSEKTPFEKIKGYRAYSGDDEQLKNLKKYWSLPVIDREQERLDGIYERLEELNNNHKE